MTSTPGRLTRQQTALRELLDTQPGFRSAQQLHAELAAQGQSIGLATVYRTLGRLADRGDIDALVGSDGETRYRRCSRGHHHHLVCRDCGRAVEVAGRAVEDWTRQVAADQGFSQISHTLEIFGVCPDCTQATDTVQKLEPPR